MKLFQPKHKTMYLKKQFKSMIESFETKLWRYVNLEREDMKVIRKYVIEICVLLLQATIRIFLTVGTYPKLIAITFNFSQISSRNEIFNIYWSQIMICIAIMDYLFYVKPRHPMGNFVLQVIVNKKTNIGAHCFVLADRLNLFILLAFNVVYLQFLTIGNYLLYLRLERENTDEQNAGTVIALYMISTIYFNICMYICLYRIRFYITMIYFILLIHKNIIFLM